MSFNQNKRSKSSKVTLGKDLFTRPMWIMSDTDTLVLDIYVHRRLQITRLLL